MSDIKYYVLCKDNCEFEAMSKEQILAAIQQAVSTGEIKDVDTGFVTKIKELNSGAALSFWVGSSAEYNEKKSTIPSDTFVIISDDNTKDMLLNNINGILDGKVSVPNAHYAAVCGYASEDFAKGTIEERLTRLGFKEGSITLDSSLTSNGAVLKNTIKRQGNYVLMDFEWDYWGANSMQSIEPINVIGKVPSEFMVNSATTCGYAIINIFNSTTLSNEVIVDNVKILEDGSVQIYAGDMPTCKITHIKFGIGYEAAPIN